MLKYIQRKCHQWQERYGTKYMFVAVAAVVGANVFLSSITYFLAEDINSWFDAIYWTITTISTVGYGDITPVTIVGKVVAMLNMIIGVALFPMFGAMVVGIINNIWQKKTAVENCELKKQNAQIIVDLAETRNELAELKELIKGLK